MNSHYLEQMHKGPENTKLDKLYRKLWNYYITTHSGLLECLSFLTQCRKDSFYQEIKKKIENKTYNDYELLYFAFTTDELTQLDIEALKRCQKNIPLKKGMELNLDILIQALSYEKETDSEKKKAINISLRNALEKRWLDRHKNLCFLNLPGINLEGADLTMALMGGFANLEGANFKNTLLEGMEFNCSNLDKINLEGAASNAKRKYYPQGPSGINFMFSTVREANLNNFYMANSDISGTDFSYSSFRHAKIEYTSFRDVNFSDTDCTYASIAASHLCNTKIKFDRASLVRTDLKDLDLSEDSSLNYAKPLANTAFLDAYHLTMELNEFQLELENLKKTEDDNSFLHKALLRAATNQIATFIKNNDSDKTELLNLINAALAHSIFQPDSLKEQRINSATQSIYKLKSLLFSTSNEYHAYYPSDAQAILEPIRDKIAAQQNQNRY